VARALAASRPRSDDLEGDVSSDETIAHEVHFAHATFAEEPAPRIARFERAHVDGGGDVEIDGAVFG
jgi:hypothetical protein